MMRVGVDGEFSQWVEVVSGIPQGSVLGPLLFILYVNDLPQWIKNSMRMFADDAKVWTRINSQEDSLSFQKNLNSSSKWSDMWLLGLNPDKCHVMHVGHSYQTKYHIAEDNQLIELTTVMEEKDLGVFTSDLRPSRQCSAAASRASSVLGLIKRNFKRLDKANFLLLYKAYVRPHLKYCIQVCNPFLVRDIGCLESVQRRATQLVAGFRYKPYEERLKIVGVDNAREA